MVKRIFLPRAIQKTPRGHGFRSSRNQHVENEMVTSTGEKYYRGLPRSGDRLKLGHDHVACSSCPALLQHCAFCLRVAPGRALEQQDLQREEDGDLSARGKGGMGIRDSPGKTPSWSFIPARLLKTLRFTWCFTQPGTMSFPVSTARRRSATMTSIARRTIIMPCI